MSISLRIPIATVSEANQREHWAAKARRVKNQRGAVRVYLKPKLTGLRLPLVVKLVRLAPRRLDDDNLRGAFKAVRDEIAALLGVNDGGDLVKWEYEQRKDPKALAPAILIEIEELLDGEAGVPQ